MSNRVVITDGSMKVFFDSESADRVVGLIRKHGAEWLLAQLGGGYVELLGRMAEELAKADDDDEASDALSQKASALVTTLYALGGSLPEDGGDNEQSA